LKIPDFELERWKAKFVVPGVIDLTETGIPEPLRLREVMTTTAMLDDVLDLKLDYATIYGNTLLRERIAQLYSNVEKDNVLVTSSTSEGNMISVNTLVNNGDEVLIQVPSFMQIPGLLEANGVRIRKYNLKPENDWELDVDELNECVTSKTKLLAFNYPNNPTGRVLDKSQVKAICEIAKDNDAWIVADEVYRGIELDGPFSPSFAEYSDRAVISSSLSKVWGLAGLRLGWMIGPKDIVERGSAFKEYTTLGSSLLSEYIGTIVLEEKMNEKLVDRGRKLCRESFLVYDDWIRTHEDVFSYIPPEFGVITLVKHNLPISSDEFASKLRSQKKVAVIPCDTCFPDIEDSAHYLRICYCHPPSLLKEAFGRIDELIEELSVAKKVAA
jgi:aspartate/methionine/tyrosine aminotransferase